MVLHKTMKLPTTCNMCWMAFQCHEWITEPCRWKGYDKRLDNCPLVEVEEKRVVCNKQRITAFVERREDGTVNRCGCADKETA